VAEKENRVTVTIFGEEYSLKGTASSSHMAKLAQYVDQRMHEMAERLPKIGTAKIAVLAALTIADDLYKLDKQHHRLTEMFEEEWKARKERLTEGQAERQVAEEAAGEAAAADAATAVSEETATAADEDDDSSPGDAGNNGGDTGASGSLWDR